MLTYSEILFTNLAYMIQFYHRLYMSYSLWFYHNLYVISDKHHLTKKIQNLNFTLFSIIIITYI